MKIFQFKPLLSTITLFSLLTMATTAKAAPVHFNQVVQVVDAKPGKSADGNFSQLRLTDDNGGLAKTDGDGDKKPSPQQNGRVITETKAEIVQDDACDCAPLVIPKGGFPKYPLFGLGAIPFLFLIPHGSSGNDTPTPTQPPGTPTTPTPTPGTPTPTPTTPTPTPITPTPIPPAPVPEPMTILLFGTGLASIGLAARRKFGKKREEEKQD